MVDDTVKRLEHRDLGEALPKSVPSLTLQPKPVNQRHLRQGTRLSPLLAREAAALPLQPQPVNQRHLRPGARRLPLLAREAAALPLHGDDVMAVKKNGRRGVLTDRNG